MAAEGRRVLITGIAGRLAGGLAARLEADERVEAVVGVDLTEPEHPLGRTQFVRADLGTARIADVVESSHSDTVVHLALTSTPRQAGGRARMKERNVIGTMQLLGAAQRASRVRSFVMRSSTAVYGSTPADPALFHEDAAPGVAGRSGYAKDVADVEGYARALARQRGDVALTVLRFANLIGPGVDTALTRYLGLPVVPTVLGYDPRLQLCHIDDAVEVLYRSVVEDHAGVYNVAGPGVIYLSQALRLAGKASVPVAAPVGAVLAGLLRRSGRVDFSPEQLAFLRYGRVADVTRLRTVFGYEPQHSTKSALSDFLGFRPVVVGAIS